MPSYSVQTIDSAGKSHAERVDANSEQEAITALAKKNLTVVELKLADGPAPSASAATGKAARRVPVGVALAFYEQLSFLIRSGIPVFLAIKMLGDSLKHPALAHVLKSVMFELSEGFPLSSSLQKFPDSFPPLHTNLIAVGEKSGNLDSALGHLVELVREQQDIREKIIKAAAYPVFLLVLSFSLVVGLLIFIFPKFEEIFKAFGVKLPALTEFLIQTSQVMRSNGPLLLAGFVAACLSIFYFLRSDQVSETRDKFILKIPVIREVFISMFVAVFTKTLSSLLKAGIPLLDGLIICQNTVRGRYKYKFFEKLIGTVREGDRTSKAMENSPLIPEMARQLVIVGETTGSLDAMMENIFLFYKKRYNEMLNQTAAILQPLLLFFAAGLIAVVAISLFVPLFKLGSAMRSGS